MNELSRAIEIYAAAVETSIVTAEAYQKAKIALDIAWRQKEEIRATLTPKE